MLIPVKKDTVHLGVCFILVSRAPVNSLLGQLTNGGGITEKAKAKELTSIIGHEVRSKCLWLQF